MATSNLVLGIPAAVLELQQKGLIERAFHDGLFPNLAFRAEAMAEEWPANTGVEMFMSRPGLLTPIVKPLAVGADPQPQTVTYEQWSATLQQFSGAIDTHIPTSATAAANLFLRNIHQLGLQSGQSINRIARNQLFQAYLSGQTLLTAATATTDTQLAVASINGFVDVVIAGTNVAPRPVGPANPLPIKLGATGAVSCNVVGAIPNDPAEPLGPGILLLAAQVGTVVATRGLVKSAFAPRIVRTGGGATIDALTSAQTVTLQDVINAVAQLRRSNVQPHPDGFYHAHISSIANSQFFADPVFQRLNQSLPEHVIYKEGFIGTISGVMFFLNNEAPEQTNSGTLIGTGVNAKYATEICADAINESAINVGRILVTGRGAVYEKFLNEDAFVTEAGLNGKVGEFDVVNNNVAVLTERIRLVLRAPMDRLQQVVGAAWSISTSFPIPSDLTAPSGPERYKRAIIIEHALV